MSMNILLVDDDRAHRESIAEFIDVNLGHTVAQSSNGRQALEIFQESPFTMVLTDIRMPNGNGIKLLRNIKKLPQGRDTDVVLFTGFGDVKSAVAALRAGAYDYLQKPVDVEELAEVVSRVEEHQAARLKRRKLRLQSEKGSEQGERGGQLEEPAGFTGSFLNIVGLGKMGVFSAVMRDIVKTALLLHRDRSLTVLIEGETGTGKELIARLVHYGTAEDMETPFISLNCSAISPNLFESELFGYESGAFTGAKKGGQIGKFELARGGTLLLDEIGDMSLDLQPKLLRVLQEKSFYRVGGLKKIEIDTRIICATNQDLDRMVCEGSFRKDLFFRLNMGRIRIPSLRLRKDEIAPLAQMFLETYAERKKRRFRLLCKEAADILHGYSWPGNVRELENVIDRVVLLYDDVELRPDHLRFLVDPETTHSLTQPPFQTLREGEIVLPPDGLNLEAVEMEIIEKSLKLFGGNKTRAAAYLGMTRSTLRSRIRKLFKDSSTA